MKSLCCWGAQRSALSRIYPAFTSGIVSLFIPLWGDLKSILRTGAAASLVLVILPFHLHTSPPGTLIERLFPIRKKKKENIEQK